MSTKLYLIRHGETTMNADNILSGQLDVELSERGLRQAEQICARLCTLPIDAFYASDLQRAYRTVEAAAAAAGKPLQRLPALREIDLGEWSGLPRDVIVQRYAAEWAAWTADPQHVRRPGGESDGMVLRRVLEELERLAARHEGETVAVAGHAGAFKIALAGMLGMEIRYRNRLTLSNASLTLVEWHPAPGQTGSAGTWQARFINDTSHLK